MVEPIKPSEVTLIIPDFIIEAVNNLIKEKWTGEEAVIYQDDILNIIAIEKRTDETESSKPTRREVFDHHWLDIEPIYRKVGWNVEYDKPAYCENYRAHFIFKKK